MRPVGRIAGTNGTDGESVEARGGRVWGRTGSEADGRGTGKGTGQADASATRVMLAPSCWNLRSMFSYPR